MTRARRVRGFTLVEMAMAMAITAITALSVAGATIALSKAHQDTEGFYQSLQTARGAMMRIQRSIQGAKLITACTGPTLVLWAEDTDNSKRINADEIAMLVFDSTTREVRMYRLSFPAAVHDSLNVEVPLDTLVDTTSAAAQVISSAYAETIVLASDTGDFFATPSPAPPMTTRVGLRLSIGTGTNAITLRSAASTRGAKTAMVAVVGGDYVLVGY